MSEETTLLEGAVPPAENTALFGHARAEAFLAAGYRSGKGHHAILIEGPQGIGKATLAFRFAHHVLAHPDPAGAPQTLAPPDPGAAHVRQIAAGASHHLLHLTRPRDEKTGRLRGAITVEEVRRAGRFLAQTSGTGNWRIVIVDPADDLNRSAANAILKILEEPPRRALFLVISHAPGKLLATIRSRCLPLRLKPLGAADLRAALAAIGISPATEAGDLEGVIARAEGSVSRALVLLRYGGLEIAETFERIVAHRGADTIPSDVGRLADALAARDRETAFDFFAAYAQTWAADRARQAAAEGDVERAARLAALTARIGETLATAGAYNLDRRQTVISLLTRLTGDGAAI